MDEKGRVPPEMRLCRGCRQFVWPDSETCCFCGGDLRALEKCYDENQTALRHAINQLKDELAERELRARAQQGRFSER